MADKKSVQSEHPHCASCIKLKEESCLEVKKSLEECARAHEDARIEKEQAVAKELKEAKTKINKLQKTLSAFQLATTVGVTILGQEAFDKIFNKVEQVQNVQAKITEIAPVEKKQTTHASKEPEKISENTNTQKIRIDFTDLLQQFESLDRISQAKVQITKTEVSDTPWIPEDTTVTADTSTGGKLIIDPPVVPPITVASVTNYDFPLILMATPNTLLGIQYPILPFQDSPFVFGQFETSVIPEFKYTGSISLLVTAAYISPRRRNV
jgi:hypothetical protein